MGEVKKLWFHEDDYKQVELLPKENFFSSDRYSQEFQKKSENSLSEKGFVNIYSRKQVNVPLRNRSISKGDFCELLGRKSIVFYGDIYWGYSSYEEKIVSCEGFGYENYVLLYRFQNNTIESCWVVYKKISETLNIYPLRFQITLESIGKKWDLILVDWNEFVVIELSKKDDLTKYIDSL